MGRIDTDYTYNERSFLSNLIYASKEFADDEKVKKLFRCTKPDMFFDRQSRDTYIMTKELYETDGQLFGTEHFRRKLKQIASIEQPKIEFFIIELEKLWDGFATINIWLKKIQDFYFHERFKKAENEEQFEQVIKEKQEYSIEQPLSDLEENAEEVINKYEQKRKTSIFTPYKCINSLVGSLQGGDMIVLAGLPGSGKTAFMLNIAKEISRKKNVIIFSLEMPKEQLQQRIYCSEARINSLKFRDFTLTDEEKRRYVNCIRNNSKLFNLHIYKKQTVTISEIRYVVKTQHPDLVLIDYLGLINSYDNKSNYEKFSNISRDIKLLAMEANVPIIALHQLNREIMSEQRKDKTPKTSDLRDSGKIEQDADMIWFVHREHLFNESIPASSMTFILAKNRHGETKKKTELIFNGDYQLITERMI